MEAKSIIVIAILGFLSRECSGYCWQAGMNPGFTGPPSVQQIAINQVRVNFGHVVKMSECADNFLIKFWPRTSPNDYDMTDLAPSDSTFIDVEVIPKVVYQFQVIAREDKGKVFGVEYNKSPMVDFKTSSLGPKRKEDAVILTPKQAEAKSEMASPEATQGTITYPDESKPLHILGLSVEIFVGAVIVCLIVLLVIVGIIYKCVTGNKKIELDDDDDDVEKGDDEDDEDDSSDESEQLDPGKNA